MKVLENNKDRYSLKFYLLDCDIVQYSEQEPKFWRDYSPHLVVLRV
jgi:hypothetical protein